MALLSSWHYPSRRYQKIKLFFDEYDIWVWICLIIACYIFCNSKRNKQYCFNKPITQLHSVNREPYNYPLDYRSKL